MPTLGETPITTLCFLVPIVFDLTWNPRFSKTVVAACKVKDFTLGTVIVLGPLEMVIVTFAPFAIGALPSGSCEITLPAGTESL